MIPAAFAYARPTTIDEALQAVASGGEDVKIMAGGQSLIPVMRLRLAAPETVVDLTKVAELRGVREEDDAIVIGAMTTHSDVLADPLMQAHLRDAGRCLPLPDEGCTLLGGAPGLEMWDVVPRAERHQLVRQPGGRAPLPAELVDAAGEVQRQARRDRVRQLPSLGERPPRGLQARVGKPEHP